MQSIRRIYYKALRFLYLLGKYVASMRKNVIIYTKKHPIYTSVFEDEDFSKYTFAYIPIKEPQLSWLEQQLISRSVLIHADATSFPNNIPNKKFVAECEGKPDDFFFTDPRVKKVLVESRSCGNGFLGVDSRVALCYPSITPNTRVEKSAGSPITLLCAGHGGYIKGYDVIYRLYKTLSQQYNVKLIIAGSFGHNYQAYPEVTTEAYERENFGEMHKELAADKNVVIQSFKRSEMMEHVYKSADIYLQFSRMETFGYSILEAMSFGLPVVSCNFKAISELVQHNENGYLVYSNGYNVQVRDYEVNINSVEWGDNCYNESLGYITGLIKDVELRTQMGKRSLEIVSEKFNLSGKIAFLEQLYSGIIADEKK